MENYKFLVVVKGIVFWCGDLEFAIKSLNFGIFYIFLVICVGLFENCGIFYIDMVINWMISNVN